MKFDWTDKRARFGIVIDPDPIHSKNAGGRWLIVELLTGEVIFRHEFDSDAIAELQTIQRLDHEGRMP